jgi:hypothetical protein
VRNELEDAEVSENVRDVTVAVVKLGQDSPLPIMPQESDPLRQIAVKLQVQRGGTLTISRATRLPRPSGW